MFYYLIKFLQSLQSLCVPVCNIFIVYLVCNAWSCAAVISFSFSLQISPRQPQERVFFANKLCIHTSNILVMYFFAFTLFLRNLLILLSCVECLSFMCHCSHLIGLILLQPLLNCWIDIWLIAFVTLNNIYNMEFCIFCFQIFCNIISALYSYVTSICNRLLPSFSLLCVVYIIFWVMHFIHC